MPQQDLILPEGWDGYGSPPVYVSEILQTLWSASGSQPAAPVIAVERFGAKGDGVTDDSAAFLEALTTIHSIQLSPGKTYAMANGIAIPFDGCSVYGNGAQILATDPSGTLFGNTGMDDFLVDGVDFRGSGVTHVSEMSALVLAGACERAIIRNCHFKNFRGVALKINSALYPHVHHNRFGSQYDGQCVNWTTTTGLRIENNIVYEIGDGPAAASQNDAFKGINIAGSANNVKTVVRGNLVVAVARMGIEVPDSEDLIVEGNYLLSTGHMAISCATPTRGIIRDNVILAAGNNGIEVTNAEFVKILRNHIQGTTEVGIILDMQSSGKGNYAQIIGNHLYDGTPGKIGIRLLSGTAGNSDFIRVEDNILHNAGGIEQDTTGGSYNRINGNTVLILENGHTPAMRLRGIGSQLRNNFIYYAASLTYTTAMSAVNATSPVITDNEFVGNSSVATGLDGDSSTGSPGAVIERNRISGCNTADIDWDEGTATAASFVDNTYGVANITLAASGKRREINPPTSTTASLAAIGGIINTQGKYTGKAVYNTTTKRLVMADGATAGAVWVDATGTTAHTPV